MVVQKEGPMGSSGNSAKAVSSVKEWGEKEKGSD